MTPERQIFFDPQRKRWKRLRRILDIAALIFTVVVAIFIFNVMRAQHLPELLISTPKHNYKALRDPKSDQLRAEKAHERPARRKSNRKASEIPLNSGEGLRAAWYVTDDAASYSSFKEHVHQLDMLFPEWLHVSEPDGALVALNSDNQIYPVIDAHGRVHDPDDENKIKRVIQAAREDTEIFPHLTSYDTGTQSFNPAIGAVLTDPAKRTRLEAQIVQFLTLLPVYRGLSLDLENLPDEADESYLVFIQELYAQLHPRNLRLYVSTAVSTEDDDLKRIAANSDGIVLMNYD